MPQDYEHKVSITHKNGNAWPEDPPTRDPKEAGDRRRRARQDLQSRGGGIIELKRRPVAPWETVESETV